MASQWRIRHKLMLGLALVVGILALLLAGSIEGLASYRTTMNTMGSKLVELSKAQKLQEAITNVAAPFEQGTQPSDEPRKLQERIDLAWDAFGEYQKAVQETLDRGRDPDNGFQEKLLIDALEQRFVQLKTAIDNANGPRADFSATAGLRNDAGVNKAISDLVETSNNLQGIIYTEMFGRIDETKRHFRTSMWIVGSTSLVGLLLMAGLSRFLYAWVFYPIRDLGQGVGRVAQGDFEHKIELHSGDEMEELAQAFNDMTARLQATYHDLERQVNERSRQLVRSERLASVGFLAAGVAHEINNPLHAIALCSEALEGRVGELLARQATGSPKDRHQHDAIVRHLRTIQEEAFRCKAITERLLEFSRGGERKREPVELDVLIQSVLDAAQHLPNARGKRITFQPAGRVVAWVNALEIKSVVLNLVVNALDSMDDGGSLIVTLRQRDGQAELVFADTGCGMGPDVLENIFEPFYTRNRSGKGTGLGLTISHRIVVQHGGEIEAASPGPRQGSTFTVRLPLQQAEGAGVRGQESGVRDQGSAVGGNGSGVGETDTRDKDSEGGASGHVVRAFRGRTAA